LKSKKNALVVDPKQLSFIRIKALMEKEYGFQLRGTALNVDIHTM